MAKSITSANSRLVITAASRNVAVDVAGSTGISAIGALAGLLGVPTTIQGWSSNQFLSASQQTSTEVQLGIDDEMHVGWLPTLVPMQINLWPDSDSQDYLEQLTTIQSEMKEALLITAELLIPSLSKKYSLTNGALQAHTPIPGHARVLQEQGTSFVFHKRIPMAY